MKLRFYRFSYSRPDTRGKQVERMLDYLWDASRGATWSAPGEWRPPVDVFQTATEVSVVVELAGMDEDDIEVILFDDVLVITGERKPLLSDGEDLQYHEAGVRYGRFRAEVLLPVPVVADGVGAWYEHGLLRITLPKQEKVRVATERLGRTEE